MEFSGKMFLKIILKVTKKQGFTLSLEDTFFEEPEGGSILLSNCAICDEKILKLINNQETKDY